MVKLSARLSSSGTMIAALSLLVAFPLSVCVPTHDTCLLAAGKSAANSTIVSRADTDKTDEWFPFPPTAFQLTDPQIDQLSATDKQKGRLRRAQQGLRMYRQMQAQTPTPPTRFVPGYPMTSNTWLKAHGWVTRGTTEVNDLARNGLNPAFQGLGIRTGLDDWIESTITHERETVDKETGQIYPPTRGTYQSLFNFKDGVIVSLVAFSPDVMALKDGHRVPEKQIVPLKTFSDVVFLNWRGVMSHHQVDYDKSPKIQHIFQHNIADQGTIQVLKSVTGKKTAAEVGKWPGMMFETCSAKGFVLLNTPDMWGPALLLAQHKQGGPRVIDRMNVFDCGLTESGTWCVYMHVGSG
ncbi:hypothetical protein CB0940_03903 [Cercospora beticola]|uniref:Uncharacterized protein n=1 Tax=Cercospora beticola TaxID=122368 RepID=A0A2G5HLQ4_CERBT|nr:hypothetical protein CB0940_03903 [Cercospora beticola]PIA93494.1 hypothetical protein CB0940_03903 [Cercospora beticola]WPB01105.1 hypothetical protein RHO25_005726 [Cercospora beticola]